MTISSKFSDNLLFVFAVSMPLSIFQFHRIPLSLVLLLSYMLVTGFSDIKIKMSRENALFLCLGTLSLISTGMCMASDMGNSWKLSGFFNLFLFLILLYFKFFYSEIIKIDLIIKGLKLGCLFNLAWCYIQLAFYNLCGIDVNDLIFHQSLNLMETASAYRDGSEFCVTGFGWHPAQLVPIIILSYFMFDNLLVRILIIGVSVFSNNSTCLITMAFCVVGTLLIEIIKGKGELKARRVSSCIVMLIVFIVASFFNYDLLASIVEKFGVLIDRIGQVLQSSYIEDKSTFIHARYYSYYPNIFSKQTILQKLFGIGYECSGYPYTQDLDQYSVLNDWIPETDYINFIIGRGWIWTILFYSWLIYGFFKARKLSAFYILYAIIVVICGVVYNNQFWWVIIAEIIMIEATKNNKNIFDTPLSEKISLAGL